jgi:hypothetical protein
VVPPANDILAGHRFDLAAERRLAVRAKSQVSTSEALWAAKVVAADINISANGSAKHVLSDRRP